jgi:carboxyl-terminal processing protease
LPRETTATNALKTSVTLFSCKYISGFMYRSSLIITSFLILSINLVIYGQSRETRKFIKEVKSTINEKSIVAENMDWAEIDKELSSIPFTGNHEIDKENVYGVLERSLKNAGDNHSVFLSRQVSSEITRIQKENVYATSKYLDSNIGYLKIPHCITFDYQKDLEFADTIIKQIEKLDAFEIDKWIIDLRDNSGGNVWPMLSGLTPIIGDGLINYSIAKSKETPNYIKQGSISNYKASTVVYNTKRKFKKIAVLVNQHTASSGEMLAISLLGFENTRVFGYKTRGLTTFNSTFSFKEGTMLFLATGFMADKNKKIYRNGITPDMFLENDLSDVDILDKLIKWLNE